MLPHIAFTSPPSEPFITVENVLNNQGKGLSQNTGNPGFLKRKGAKDQASSSLKIR
jgi:hypothetical protein